MSDAFLVTGVQSGLGKFLHEQFGGVGLTRANSSSILENKKIKYDAIIHCAFNSKSALDSHGKSENISLIESLVQLPHKKFILLSSADVYTPTEQVHIESLPLNEKLAKTDYSRQKILCEQTTQKLQDLLILRPTSLLGPYMRPNNLWKLMRESQPQLSLTADSTLNFVLYSHLRSFIEIAIQKNISGIYNVASSKNIQLDQIAKKLNRSPQFGQFKYSVGAVSNDKIKPIISDLKFSSEEILEKFMSAST